MKQQFSTLQLIDVIVTAVAEVMRMARKKLPGHFCKVCGSPARASAAEVMQHTAAKPVPASQALTLRIDGEICNPYGDPVYVKESYQISGTPLTIIFPCRTF